MTRFFGFTFWSHVVPPFLLSGTVAYPWLLTCLYQDGQEEVVPVFSFDSTELRCFLVRLWRLKTFLPRTLPTAAFKKVSACLKIYVHGNVEVSGDTRYVCEERIGH